MITAVPRENPKIEGLESYYSEGDILSANCTSDFGDPAPTLRWYVDDEPVRTLFIYKCIILDIKYLLSRYLF